VGLHALAETREYFVMHFRLPPLISHLAYYKKFLREIVWL